MSNIRTCSWCLTSLSESSTWNVKNGTKVAWVSSMLVTRDPTKNGSWRFLYTCTITVTWFEDNKSTPSLALMVSYEKERFIKIKIK